MSRDSRGISQVLNGRIKNKMTSAHYLVCLFLLVDNETDDACEPFSVVFDPPFPEHVESMRVVLPNHIHIGERSFVVFVR